MGFVTARGAHSFYIIEFLDQIGKGSYSESVKETALLYLRACRA